MKSDLTKEQQAPTPERPDKPAIWNLVIDDMRARDQEGRRRYGTPLQAHNGRDPLVDGYQEALDLAVYLRQAIEERRVPSPTAGCYGDEYVTDLRARWLAEVADLQRARDGARREGIVFALSKIAGWLGCPPGFGTIATIIDDLRGNTDASNQHHREAIAEEGK